MVITPVITLFNYPDWLEWYMYQNDVQHTLCSSLVEKNGTWMGSHSYFLMKGDKI